MATAPSLFGATPDELQQQQAAALDEQAMQYAKMDPFERATMGIYRGANQLGGAIGGMLGGTDPQMQRLQQRQQMLQGINQSDPQSWLQLASKLSAANDFKGAQEAVAKAQELQAAGTKNRLDESIIAKNLSEKSTPAMKDAAALASTLAQPGTPEYTEAYNKALTQLTDKPTNEITNARVIAERAGKPGTPAYIKEFNGAIDRLTDKTKSADKLDSKIAQFEYARTGGYKGTFEQFIAIAPSIMAGAVAPLRAAEIKSMAAKNEYNLPAAPAASFSVKTPDGRSFKFKDQQSANAFKANAGIK